MKPRERQSLLEPQDVVLSDTTVFLYCSNTQNAETVPAIPDSRFCNIARLGTLKTLKGFLMAWKLEEKEIVCYQETGIDLAAQVWWLLQVIGHDQVQVLDGGLRAYTAIGGRTTLLSTTAPPDLSIDVEIDVSKYKTDGEIRTLVAGNSRNFQLVDTDGRCLGAVNCNAGLLIDEKGGMSEKDGMQLVLMGVGVKCDPAVTTIVIGKAAPVVLLSLSILGMHKLCLGIVKRDSDEFLPLPVRGEDASRSQQTEFYSISGNTEYFDARAEEERSLKKTGLIGGSLSLQVTNETNAQKSPILRSEIHQKDSEPAETQHSCNGCQVL